jgi:hypothetical protein
LINREILHVAGLISSASLVRKFTQRFETPFTGLFLTAGLFVTVHPDLLANQAIASADRLLLQPSHALMSEVPAPEAMADGTYFYGQAPERDQIGSAYMVFTVEQGDVVGAFYMPHSSFDCFYGSVEPDQLALTVVDSYEQTHHPYAIALAPSDAVATVGNGAVTPVSLEGFHPLAAPNENDLRILSTCQSDIQ